MALKLYYKNTSDQYVAISSGTDLTSTLNAVHDGRTGDTVTIQLYLRNDDNTKWFSNILLRPLDLVDPDPYGDIAYSETGWGVKLSAGSSEPTTGEWEDIEWGGRISMSDIGSDSLANTTTYYPLWYLVTCPPNTDAQIKTDIVINTSYTENAVI
jgi:hypothetical protein